VTKVRWGVLSTADIGMSKVTPAIQKAENCDVVAIASRDAYRATAAAATLGIPGTYGSYEELLGADDIDAVYIPLPNNLHAEWTTKAAEAGKHVLCEKPLALKAAQAAEMVAACEAAGVKLAEAFMYRHHPTWVDAVGLVRSGSIGELQAVQSYNINSARLLFDAEPSSIAAAVRRDPVMGIDTLTSAVLEFPGGAQATFTCTTRAEDGQKVHIVGTEGRIEIEIPFNIPPDRETRIFVTAGGDPPVAPDTETRTFAPADQYTIQASLFAQAIIDDTDVAVAPSDAVANMKVIDTILASG
jgi:predicted dehydrogenase